MTTGSVWWGRCSDAACKITHGCISDSHEHIDLSFVVEFSMIADL